MDSLLKLIFGFVRFASFVFIVHVLLLLFESRIVAYLPKLNYLKLYLSILALGLVAGLVYMGIALHHFFGPEPQFDMFNCGLPLSFFDVK